MEITYLDDSITNKKDFLINPHIIDFDVCSKHFTSFNLWYQPTLSKLEFVDIFGNYNDYMEEEYC